MKTAYLKMLIVLFGVTTSMVVLAADQVPSAAVPAKDQAAKEVSGSDAPQPAALAAPTKGNASVTNEPQVGRPQPDPVPAAPAEAVAPRAVPTTPAPQAPRRRLGIDVGPAVVIRRVENGSDAERCGLRPGDVILAVDGRPTPTHEDLLKALDAAQRPVVKVEIWRQGTSLRMLVPTTLTPDAPAPTALEPAGQQAIPPAEPVAEGTPLGLSISVLNGHCHLSMTYLDEAGVARQLQLHGPRDSMQRQIEQVPARYRRHVENALARSFGPNRS